MDRMGLSDEECRFLDVNHVALHFKGFYDRFTRYIRENAMITEYLQYGQFMKQLRKSELYTESKTVRMGNNDPKKVIVLDYGEIKRRCDVDGFIKAQVQPI